MLKTLRKNKKELIGKNIHILFSYETPVAYYDVLSDQYFVTDEHYSKSTTQHINSWVDKSRVKQCSQDVLDNLI